MEKLPSEKDLIAKTLGRAERNLTYFAFVLPDFEFIVDKATPGPEEVEYVLEIFSGSVRKN